MKSVHEQLVGKPYLIRNVETDEVVGQTPILEATPLENFAGIALRISRDPNAGLIVISYADALRITQGEQ
jgi:hypothetical protein